MLRSDLQLATHSVVVFYHYISRINKVFDKEGLGAYLCVRVAD